MRKLKIFTIIIGISILITGGTAFAVPYALNFDPDAAGADFDTQAIYGWDLEAYAEDFIPGVGGPFDIVTRLSLGPDDILNNMDTFTESFTVDVLRGLNGPPVYPAFGPAYGEGVNPTANLFIDIDLSGIIANYDSGGPGPTTAANAATALADDTFTTDFKDGSARMYVDANNNFDYDAGETTVSTYSFDDATPFLFVPSVFAGEASIVSFAFKVESLNPAYFSQAPGFPDPFDLVANDWLLTLAQGGVELARVIGDETTDPDQILFGFAETGFDARFDAVPEPTTITLMGIGLLGLAWMGRKKLFK